MPKLQRTNNTAPFPAWPNLAGKRLLATSTAGLHAPVPAGLLLFLKKRALRLMDG